MAIPVARVHLKVAHAALPALLPTPPMWKILPLHQTPPPPCFAAIHSKRPPVKPIRAHTDERWDAHKANPRSAANVVKSSAGHGASPRKDATPPPPPPKPGRADAVERWDAHKKPASPAASSSPSSSVVSSKCSISRASAAERSDVHKKRCPPPQAEPIDDGESSSTGCNDIDDMEEEEILWKPRAMYAGPGFVVAAPQPSMIPMPAFLVPVA